VSRNNLPVIISNCYFLLYFPMARFVSEREGNFRSLPQKEEPDFSMCSSFRLGALGFLFLDDDAAPGNVGLEDARAALVWIRANVDAFEGDPNRITLAGAGGSASIALALAKEEGVVGLVLHDQARRSFLPPEEAFKRSLSLANLLGCGPSSTLSSRKSEVAACLSQLPAEDLVDKEMGVADGPEGVLVRQPFGPVIDHKSIFDNVAHMLPEESQLSVLIGGSEDSAGDLARLLPSSYPFDSDFLPELERGKFEEGVRRALAGQGDAVSARSDGPAVDVDNDRHFGECHSFVASHPGPSPVDEISIWRK